MIGGWEPDLVQQIRPKEMRLSLESQLEIAEKTFLSEARVVSTGPRGPRASRTVPV